MQTLDGLDKWPGVAILDVLRFAGTAYAVRKDILENGIVIHQFESPQILFKSELGDGRVDQVTRLRCDSAGDYPHTARVLLHTHLGSCFPL